MNGIRLELIINLQNTILIMHRWFEKLSRYTSQMGLSWDFPLMSKLPWDSPGVLEVPRESMG